MIEIFLVPIALMMILVAIHAWFGAGILQRGILFTDLAIAQAAALGSAVSLGYFHGEHLIFFTLTFALASGLMIAWATTRTLHLEAFIGLMYVLGASGILMVLSHSAEGMEHFKSLLANDILFTTTDQFFKAFVLYGVIGLFAYFLYPRLDGFAREALFFTLLSLTVTSSVQLAGVLVVFVLLVAPVLVASMQRKLAPFLFALIYGWGISLVSVILAFYADLPTGFTFVFIGSLLSLSAVLMLSSQKRA